MKTQVIKWVAAGTCAALLMVAAPAQATINVTVDPGAPWLGFMNVSELPENGGAYVFGSGWGTADLPAVFTGPTLKLSPNTNTYNQADPFWTQPDGDGNKQMNANFYVEVNGLEGEDIHFGGKTVSNTFVAPYVSQAWIKVFASDYSSVLVDTYATLTTDTFFSLDLTVPNTPGVHMQYGFSTDGPNANPATVDALGRVLVLPEPSSLLLTFACAGAFAIRRRR